MKCEKCGNEIADNSVFCDNCGNKLPKQQKKFCVNCGAEMNNDAEFCGNCGFSVKNGTFPVENIHSDDDVPLKKKSKTPIIIIVLAIIIALLSAALAGYVIYDRQIGNDDVQLVSEEQSKQGSDAEDTKTDATKEELVQTKSLEEQIDKMADTAESLHRTAVGNVENKVLTIRNWYNDTQSNLESLSTVKVSESITEYYDESSCVRIDVSADEKNSYNRYYYFKDNNLYFVFAFDGQKENRLYFYDETLFRWIDEIGIIHDNDFDSTEFMSWEKTILNELDKLR